MSSQESQTKGRGQRVQTGTQWYEIELCLWFEPLLMAAPWWKPHPTSSSCLLP